MTLLLGPCLAAPAQADPGSPTPGTAAQRATQAQAEADRAAAEVRRMEPQVAAALAAYRSSLRSLASAVTLGVASDRQAEDLAAAAGRAQSVRDLRVRSLYMSGGNLAVLSTVLAATDPGDLLDRLDSVQRVVTADTLTARRADGTADRARRLADDRLARAEQVTTTVADVESAAQRWRSLLAAAQARLTTLKANARSARAAADAEAQLARLRAAAIAAENQAARTATASGIPPEYLALYKGAARTCPGLDWHVLAAIGQVESGHGRNNGPSSAGALGPMQFLPSTFAGFAVDGDKDGVKDINDPADATYTAARYLCANGAGNPRGLRGAIWRYNHADWYVDMVLRIASQLATRYP